MWDTLASTLSIEKTAAALNANGITVQVVGTGKEAKEKVLEIVPNGAEVMTMTSVTLDTIGIAAAINESGNYQSVRKQLMQMDRKTESSEMQKLGSAPDWVIGSVHAVTETGQVVIASNSGSQLPGYSYGASHVIWVVGTQKIVSDLDMAFKRVYEYSLPLEDVRAQKAYGIHSFVSKLLIINREPHPNRIALIFVKEKLGF